MLSRTATINAKPELEIFADDVKCAHGATVGELSRDALFYLASRGVPEAEAKASSPAPSSPTRSSGSARRR
jgi:Fe-S cluster assembly protein SufD